MSTAGRGPGSSGMPRLPIIVMPSASYSTSRTVGMVPPRVTSARGFAHTARGGPPPGVGSRRDGRGLLPDGAAVGGVEEVQPLHVDRHPDVVGETDPAPGVEP